MVYVKKYGFDFCKQFSEKEKFAIFCFTFLLFNDVSFHGIGTEHSDDWRYC